jgi:hypothetical protein
MDRRHLGSSSVLACTEEALKVAPLLLLATEFEFLTADRKTWPFRSRKKKNSKILEKWEITQDYSWKVYLAELLYRHD